MLSENLNLPTTLGKTDDILFSSNSKKLSVSLI